MLIACYLFDWKPFGIFISYLIEIVVLLFVYSFLRLKDEKKNPERYRKTQPLHNVFIGSIPLIVFQYFIIGWMSSHINPDQHFIQQNLLLTKEVYFAVGSMVVLYAIQAAHIANHAERLNVFRDNFLFKILSLTAANCIGFILVFGIEIESLLVVVTSMVVFRILLEIYVGRKMRIG
jgi:hypothetical protein